MAVQLRGLQFSIADLLSAMVALSFTVGLITQSSGKLSSIWALLVVAAFCEVLGIVFVYWAFNETRAEGGGGVAIWTTKLGACLGLAGSPIIVIAVPGILVVSMIIAFFGLITGTIDWPFFSRPTDSVALSRDENAPSQ